MKRYPTALVIVGPTASGKSALAQEVAKRLDACVLSADSMQVYRGMDIGTGKLTERERIVRHYGLDLIDPGKPFSAALFQEYGREVLEQQAKGGKPLVICGGTGFYVRALIDDFDFPAGEQVGNPIRDERNERLAQVGAHALWEELRAVDPDSAAIIHENDSKRVVRAFELLSEGTSYRMQRDAFSKIGQVYPATFFGLSVDPAVLNERIDRRVDAMVDSGLVDEVEMLLARGFRDGITAREAIGYKEIVSYLDGQCSLEEAVVQIKTATHRYAKRQRTWFRKDTRIHWIDAQGEDVGSMADEVLGIYSQEGGEAYVC